MKEQIQVAKERSAGYEKEVDEYGEHTRAAREAWLEVLELARHWQIFHAQLAGVGQNLSAKLAVAASAMAARNVAAAGAVDIMADALDKMEKAREIFSREMLNELVLPGFQEFQAGTKSSSAEKHLSELCRAETLQLKTIHQSAKSGALPTDAELKAALQAVHDKQAELVRGARGLEQQTCRAICAEATRLMGMVVSYQDALGEPLKNVRLSTNLAEAMASTPVTPIDDRIQREHTSSEKALRRHMSGMLGSTGSGGKVRGRASSVMGVGGGSGGGSSTLRNSHSSAVSSVPALPQLAKAVAMQSPQHGLPHSARATSSTPSSSSAQANSTPAAAGGSATPYRLERRSMMGDAATHKSMDSHSGALEATSEIAKRRVFSVVEPAGANENAGPTASGYLVLKLKGCRGLKAGRSYVHVEMHEDCRGVRAKAKTAAHAHSDNMALREYMQFNNAKGVAQRLELSLRDIKTGAPLADRIILPVPTVWTNLLEAVPSIEQQIWCRFGADLRLGAMAAANRKSGPELLFGLVRVRDADALAKLRAKLDDSAGRASNPSPLEFAGGNPSENAAAGGQPALPSRTVQVCRNRAASDPPSPLRSLSRSTAVAPPPPMAFRGTQDFSAPPLPPRA